MRYTLSLILTALLSTFAILSIAQNDPLNRHITDWFLEERFLIADQNEDALLDRDELVNFPREFSYYLEADNYGLTDENGDGLLSFREIKSRFRSEVNYNYTLEMRELRSLTGQYPNLSQADIQFLKNTPSLVKILFGNFVWTFKYPQLVEQILNDQQWVNGNSDAIVSLHKNLRWMVANPLKAERLYNNRILTQRVPELIGWRADHRNFIRQNNLLDRFYVVEFIPEPLR